MAKKKDTNKPLTQKQLKDMLAETKAAQKTAKQTLAKVESTYKELTSPAPTATVPSDLARTGITKLSPAQQEAQNALQEAMSARTAAGLQGKVVTTPGSAGQLTTPPATGLKTGYEWYAFNLPGGGVEWRQKPTKETLTASYNTMFSGGNTGPTDDDAKLTGGKTVVSTFTDDETGDTYAVYSDGSTNLISKGNKIATAQLAAQQAAAAEAAAKKEAGQSAYSLLFEQFQQYGLGALVEPLKNFIVEGLSPAEFTLRLRDTDAYRKRFAANQQRIAKGLRALSEAEYIGLEDQYQNIMRNYGLPESYYTRGDMGRQEGFEKFIAGDVSAVELEDRIQTAQNRVINAAPEISATLKQFYPNLSNGDILAYVLDPDKALTDIKRKVTAAEIGGAATMAGLATGVARAEELARYGVTAESARQGYQAIAEIAPRGGQLAEIYKQTPYTQTTAEQEVFGLTGATEAATRRKKLQQLEQASFSGSSGAAGGALARERAGQF